MTEYTNANGGVAQPKPSSAKRNKQRAYAMEVKSAKIQADAGMPAKRVYMSGAIKGQGLDGDMAAEWYLGECKNYTPVEDVTGTYLKMYIKWLDKIMDEGRISGKPGIVIYQAKGSSRAYVTVDRDQFMELMGKAYKALKGIA